MGWYSVNSVMQKHLKIKIAKPKFIKESANVGQTQMNVQLILIG
jgi:hypothetical protein